MRQKAALPLGLIPVPLTLIHTNICSNPHGCWLSGHLMVQKKGCTNGV